ncbi:hypothetical protein DPMN_093063 [Dreissena polymorpha]|uniref:Uncharacterized protein n=1 Tax=Dreissena polymorpha TaxID=45954 RepID=A0A9D4L3K6_DREPO|nr:hypothetical protein DPMN_093063 [Dreissena polymorpha]
MIGDSILHWAGVYSQEHSREVGGSLAVSWCDVRGMKWSVFQHSLQLGVVLSSEPRYIFPMGGGRHDITSGGNLLPYSLGITLSQSNFP